MRRVSFFRLPIALLVAMAALFVSTGAQVASATPRIPCRPGQPCTTWGVMTTQNPGDLENDFKATAAVSASDVWAGGQRLDSATSRPRPGARSSRSPGAHLSPSARTSFGPKAGCGCISYGLIEHWNGATWSVVSDPASTEAGTVIEGMAALASNNVWAVGAYYNLMTGGSEDRIEHWNGVSWSSSPAGTILQSEELRAVAGKTANDVWAVGDYVDAAHGNVRATEVKHWDGSSWSLVPSPNAMSGGSPIDSYLSSVAALASNDVWAVGFAGTSDAGATLIEHWDGAQWSIVASPNVSGSDWDGLSGVSASASNDVWAVGGFSSLTASGGPLIEHWNGSSWSIVTLNPALIGGGFVSVTATSPGNIWAVGYQMDGTGNILTLIERWNGSAWALQQSPPLTPGGIQTLDSVTVSPDGVALTVGSYSTSTEATQTLAIRLGLGRR